ncbi:MAG: hypothetical protein D6731_06745 [Planctomycetota bacterium]|nr:MAG: hypothetical protein D6731_06745 [Planctomycetota bacterium]
MPAFGQGSEDVDRIREAGQREAAIYEQLAQDKLKEAQAERAQADRATDPAVRSLHLRNAEQALLKAAEYQRMAQRTNAETAGMVGRLGEVQARIESEQEANKKPGFWDKLADKGVDILGELISTLLQRWLAGGGQDDDLLDQINQLREERDRLLNGGDGTGDGVGRIITDPNGTYGYDRDGDGYVDIPLNPDGTIAGPYDPTDPGAYGGNGGLDLSTDAADADGLEEGLDGLPGLSVPGGGASFAGGANGPGFGLGGASGGVGGATGGSPLPSGEEVGGGLPGATAAAEAKDMDGDGDIDADDLAAARKARDRNGDGIPDEEQLETILGRVVLLPKVEKKEKAAELSGDREEDGNWSGGFEEWGDEVWDDSADNGDRGGDSWSEEDWAAEDPKKKGKVGDAEAEARLVEELIRVETVLKEWREEAEKAVADGAAEDPYFPEDERSGFRAAGADGKEPEDPFKDVRDEDGKIDLEKVDMWVIERDTWKKGKKPVRYKVDLSDIEELKDFEPVHGGVIVARGLVEEIDVEESVLETIEGKVKKAILHEVVLSAEKPPEDMDSLDPSKLDDGDVGGLDRREERDARGEDGFDDFDGWDD